MLTYCNILSPKEYCDLRSAVAWKPIPEDQAQSGLDHSDFVIACRDDDAIVGCARVFWDKGYIAYLADVMVKPDYQRQGIGSLGCDGIGAFVLCQLISRPCLIRRPLLFRNGASQVGTNIEMIIDHLDAPLL